ncbi:MAG: CoA transferase [Gammaproteobacteria bacterium]|jgi:crotonobetainyl-CoA:carnitine CoA-transferase CaiB-like acyl-CoA transferase|nr:CoA transferase [Gammaproteobacteria bacterium]MCP4881508.1 CoA transferase [Gammaproteobacteria bacterium]MDP6165600.1 CaiB/BaiF CoA-transferase family protein [Gammaproteobacteria bacterium]
MSQEQLPLAGITIVSLEQAVAAPLCTSRLAEAGARVIKIERESGDFARGYDSFVNGQASYFVWTNRGKESLVLDIKQPSDQALLKRILAKAHVWVQNLAPGATERVGFGSEQLRCEFPHLITCDISGYGDNNSYADMKAYDLLIQSESGLVSVSGGPSEYGRIGVSLCDISAGMNALSGIQQALFQQLRTGQGTGLKVSLFDCAIDWMSVPLLQQKYTGQGPQRVGLKHPSIAPYGGFTCADGKILVISIQNEREWAQFCTSILQDAQLATQPGFSSNKERVANRSEVDALVQAAFAKQDSHNMRKQLQAAAIAFGAINTSVDLVEHDLVRMETVPTPTGHAEVIASPILTTAPANRQRAVPAIGQHTAAIKEEFASP